MKLNLMAIPYWRWASNGRSDTVAFPRGDIILIVTLPDALRIHIATDKDGKKQQ